MRDKEQDLKRLAIAFFKNLMVDNCEYGGIGLDNKRPFGNSSVEYDMLEIIGWDMEGDDGYEKCYSSKQREYVHDLYFNDLIPYLRDKCLKYFQENI